jgi:hypothetical protein
MIDINIINIVGVACLGLFIAHFYQPIQKVKEWFINLLSFLPFLHRSLDIALNCSKCSSFILALVLFWDLPAAAFASVIGYVLNHIVDRIEHWYE